MLIQKIFIISGEASGDLHGSNLVKELLQLQPNLQVQGWGGALMQQQGVTILKDYKELAFMGFAEVIKNIGTILKNFKLCKQQITAFKPDIVLFIDYPGFNLRMAKWAKLQGYATHYYISPQIWAWKEKRVYTIKKYVDKMMVILPFEKEFYNKYNYNVSYVGHPLTNVIKQYNTNQILQSPTPIIALLPGSRKQEIVKKLPIMLAVTKQFANYTFIVAKAPNIANEFYDTMLKGFGNVNTITNNTYLLLSNATAALVTSGTATLETALFKVPQVVCYKGSAVSYYIAKRLIKIKYISLVNLIMNKEVVQELIQDNFTETNLTNALTEILSGTKVQQIKVDYSNLISLLSKGNNASYNAAKLVLGV